MDLDAAAAQAVDGVVTESGADLGQDPRHRLDQHPAHLVALDGGEEAAGVAGEVFELGQRLHAGVSTADEAEGEEAAARLAIGRRLGPVHARQHVVAEVDGLGHGLEPHAALVQSGHGQDARDRSQRDDDVVVIEHGAAREGGLLSRVVE